MVFLKNFMMLNIKVCIFFVIISDISSTSTLDSDEVAYLLMDIDHKWYEIALSLRVHHSFLDDLKHSPGCSYKKLKKIIEIWKEKEPSPVTWETVITAIESYPVNEKEIANRMRQNLKHSK